MKYTTITYKRVKNIGNYQSETLELTAEIDGEKDIMLQIHQLKTTVKRGLNIISSKEETTQESEGIAF